MNERVRYVIKGLILAAALVVLNNILLFNLSFLGGRFVAWEILIIGGSFAIIVMLFLKTEKISNFFITAGVGMGALFIFEIVLLFSGVFSFGMINRPFQYILIYFIGFAGSMAGLIIALILTILKVKFGMKFNIFSKIEAVAMEKPLKVKLLSYLIISAIGFSYLILPQNAGISVPIFIIVQFVFLCFIAPKKKPLLMFIPIFILSLNSVISANTIWRVSNFFVIIVLYSVMILWMTDSLAIKQSTFQFLANILENILSPFRFFALPFKWPGKPSKESSKTIKRVLLGVAISVPFLIFLIVMLSSADQIFAHGVSSVLGNIIDALNFNMLMKIFFGVLAGFYLFGLICSAYQPKNERTAANASRKHGDLIVLNILLVSILAIYTIFVAIQFRYLFASSDNLPYGLDFVQYARRGFFELLLLTGINILLILITVRLTKEQTGKWAKLTKILCCYLCAITVVLLASSFYRMWLYGSDDGLTRLRFLVFGFLIFNAVGLVFTFFYIIKPKFNIVAVYLGVALSYYLLLNIIPMDQIIARDQINRYFNDNGGGIAYTLTLSVDAAPEIARLQASDDIETQNRANLYFSRNSRYYNSFPPRWQRWNWSVNRLRDLGD
ncbi:MAG: DUF4173 domain-containing protein [Oscillospiraceae bacterium]|nr:DUF4173 domain-containing protein [Oscillospiraceae bacterium]